MEDYRRIKRVVKRVVREARKRENEEWTLSIAENFKENKEKIWKGVNEVRNGENLRLSFMRNSMGEELRIMTLRVGGKSILSSCLMVTK